MKSLFFITLIISSLFFIKVNNFYLSYSEFYNKKKDFKTQNCSFNHGGMNLFSKECIQFKDEWHVKPCGISYWCSIKNKDIKLKKLSSHTCLTDKKLSLFDFLIKKGYYKYRDKRIRRCF
jgi:hypothetical protein